MDTESHISAQLHTDGLKHDVLAGETSGSLSHIANQAGIPLYKFVRSQLLVDDKGSFLLAIFPASNCMDMESLSRQLQKKLRPANETQIEQFFPTANPQALPPMVGENKLPTIIDSVIATQSTVYFASDIHSIIKIDTDDFNTMLDHAWYGFNFSYSLPGYGGGTQTEQAYQLPRSIEQRLTKLETLPSLPGTSRELLRLLNKDNGHVNELARILEHDPTVSAQLLKQARSALYGLGDSIKTIDAAIVKIFGYDTALHISLGISTACTFKGPKHGHIGLQRIYSDAVLVSALCESLAMHIPIAKRPARGTAQLAGLLHNLGYLVLAHMFTDEYAQLNKQLSPGMEMPINEAIKQHFDILPEHISAWLMEIWNMPQSLIIAQREQRNIAYKGQYAVHAQLVLLANRLLNGYGFGDASTPDFPEDVLLQLGLDNETVYSCVEKVIDNRAELKYLAEQLAA